MLCVLILIMPINASYVGAKNIGITDKYVTATGKCTCGLQGDYNYHTKAWINYCPNCNHKGSLSFEEGSATWTCPEGMWYCTICDMDYCIVKGKSHDNRGQYLIPFSGTINNWQVKHGYFIKKLPNLVVNPVPNPEHKLPIPVNGKHVYIKKSIVVKLKMIL